MNKNQTIEIKITDLNSEGAGVGRVDGQVVFVPYALPDETVKALIIKVAKNYAVGKLQEVVTPSPKRKEPECPHFYRCGGCDFQHVVYEEQFREKCQATLKNIRKLSGLAELEMTEAIPCSLPLGYRNKAQFPVGQTEDGLCLGFYAPHSHRLVPLKHCPLQTDECNAVLPVVAYAQKQCPLQAYDEETGRGFLRHVIARTGKYGLMVILVTNSDKPVPDTFVKALVDRLPGSLTVIQNVNTTRGNVILGKTCRTLYGQGYIEDELCGIRFRLRPLAFLQVNSVQAEKLYEKALEYASLDGTQRVFDAYCGIGVMSLMLARRSGSLTGVEIVPEAIETARESAKLNGFSNTEFLVGACEDVLPVLLSDGKAPDVLVVDPPRAGCEQSLLQSISDVGIPRLVYVSCDPATLARDMKFLAEKGYRPEKLTFVDMFPQTKHVESVVLMSRA